MYMYNRGKQVLGEKLYQFGGEKVEKRGSDIANYEFVIKLYFFALGACILRSNFLSI